MKTNAAMVAVGLIGGAALMFMLSRKTEADRLIEAGGAAPGGGAPAPGGSTEPPPEKPHKIVVEGGDLFPRYSTAMVSTSRGPELFEKEFDTGHRGGEIRWKNFKNPDAYGSYRTIELLAVNHPPIIIYDREGGTLWEAGAFTLHGVQQLGLRSAHTPLKAVVVSS